MKIPFVNLLRSVSKIQPDIETAILQVVKSGVFLNGFFTETFELLWRQQCGQKYCIACASGTDAVTIGSAAVWDRPVLEDSVRAEADRIWPWVRVPANGIKHTSIGLTRARIHPFYVDVNTHGQALPCETVMAVGLWGLYERVNASHRFVDAAQMHGWMPWPNQTAAWSFYPTKNLGAMGDGGAVTTNSEELFNRMRQWSSQSQLSRMDEIQAAVLVTKFPYLREWTEQRLKTARQYVNILPTEAEPLIRTFDPSKYNGHIFPIRVENRDGLKEFLAMCGIETKIHYPAMSDLPGAVWFCDRVLSLPIWPGISEAEVEFVADAIRRFYRGTRKVESYEAEHRDGDATPAGGVQPVHKEPDRDAADSGE